jgi:hypothetical protein
VTAAHWTRSFQAETADDGREGELPLKRDDATCVRSTFETFLAGRSRQDALGTLFGDETGNANE